MTPKKPKHLHGLGYLRKSYPSGWLRLMARELKACAAIDACWGQRGRRNPRWVGWGPRRERRSTRRTTVLYHLRADELKHTPEWKIRQAVRNACKRIARLAGQPRRPGARTIEYLGCTYDHAREHLEARFEPGMGWENYGTAWEIDHVAPLAALDLTTEDGRRQATHYANLQPLWKPDNRAKGARAPSQLAG